MIGQSGLQSGFKSFKVKRCRKCGKEFYGESDLCDECYTEENTMTVGNCVIENVPGRCLEYLRGECEKCLEVTAMLDWEGWRRIKYVCKHKN